MLVGFWGTVVERGGEVKGWVGDGVVVIVGREDWGVVGRDMGGGWSCAVGMEVCCKENKIRSRRSGLKV